MASNYIQPGEVIDWTNGTGSAVSSGDVVAIGQILGVALVDIANAATGSVQIKGVFEVPKVSGAVIAAGESLTWDVSAGAFDDNAATTALGDITGACAVAVEAAGNGVTALNVLFTGVPGTVDVTP
jgi:predicted RecA/RadA family phage recombinase